MITRITHGDNDRFFQFVLLLQSEFKVRQSVRWGSKDDGDYAGVPAFLQEPGDFRTRQAKMLGDLILGQTVLIVRLGDSV